MNSWTDILLILAIVVGLISAASLPMVSVNAVSSDALRVRPAGINEPAPPWSLISEGALEAWGMPSRPSHEGATTNPTSAIDPLPAPGPR